MHDIYYLYITRKNYPYDAILPHMNILIPDQNSGYEITINGFQINEIRKRNFRSPLWETFLSVKAEVGMFIKLSTW